MKGMLTYKNLGGSVKDVDTKGRVVTGYLSKFGNIDNHNDVMQKGAFKQSLNERRDQIFFLNQHKFDQPHGKFSVLKEDNEGLYFESAPLIKGVSYSDDALKLYEAGIMSEHSIGFITINATESKSEAGVSLRNINEVKLYEGSNVTLGANSEASFLGLKSMTVKTVDEKIKKIINYIRKGDITDDGFRLLEISLKELQVLSFELGQKALTSTQSFNDAEKVNKSLVHTITNFTNSIKL